MFLVLASMRHFDIAVEVGLVTGVMAHTGLEDARFTVYEDEREMIASTYVSTCDLQKQSNRGNLSSNE